MWSRELKVQFYYELGKWLQRTATEGADNPEYASKQIEVIQELMALRDDFPPFVANDLLGMSIELSHIYGGEKELLRFADHMTGMAESIRVRVKRDNVRAVPNPTDPVNQA